VTKTCHFFSDDDSEPILGLWFEETLAPPEMPAGSNVAQSTADSLEGAGKNNTDRAGSIVPEKGEPHGVRSTFISQLDSFHLVILFTRAEMLIA
jgi:E3 ubiquitin-protein ligase UBR4